MTGVNIGRGSSPDQRALLGGVGTNGCELMAAADKKFSRISTPERVRRIVETVFACKWSLTILTAIGEGINRPGAITRSIEGLTPKVMNFCLSRLLDFGILEKQVYPEVPPRVEYAITDFGGQFMEIFEVLDRLEAQLEGA